MIVLAMLAGLVVVAGIYELEEGADRKVRTLAEWRGAVSGLLEDVDRMVREKRNGRDPLQGQRPSGTKIQCEVYAPPKQ